MVLIFSVLAVAALVTFLIVKKEKAAREAKALSETPVGYETSAPTPEVKPEPKKRGPKPKTATMKARAANKTTKKSK